MRRTPVTLLVALLALLAVGSLAACGDDGGGLADPRPASEEDDPSGSGDDPGTTTTGDVSDNDVVCEHLGTVDQLDREAGRVTDSAVARVEAGVGEPTELIAALHAAADLFEQRQGDVDAAYAAAAAAARSDIAADIETLAATTRQITPTMIQAFRSISSIEEAASLEQAFATPEFMSAAREGAAATLRLDRYTETVCGFTMSD